MPARTIRISCLLSALALPLVLLAGTVRAQPAGEVEFARGVGFAQTAGQAPRTLGKGLPLREGDRLSTAEGAYAIVRLADGTRMTLRPNSELVLQQYRFSETAPQQNSLLMQLVRGGFRAVTGLIARSSPDAAKVRTSTATIGIRGTDFDARLCEADCGRESAIIRQSARPNAVQASARLVLAQGEVQAVDAAGKRRRLVTGGSVYPGDLVETAGGALAVLVFRDASRMTLGSGTRFRVDNFVYDERNAGEGRFLVSILRGSVRALTGLIARANNRNVGFSTATATIGIRGTGFDLRCTGACAGEPGGPDEGLTLWTWLGSIEVGASGQTALQVLQSGQGLFIPASGALQAITNQPAADGPRPDEVSVPDKLFSTEALSDTESGLFVYVRDGHIEIASGREVLHLGRSEAGFAGSDGRAMRPEDIPKFLDFDRIPRPDSPFPLLTSILVESGLQADHQCR